MDNLAGLFTYAGVIVLMMLGFYIVMDSHNLVKKMVGLNIFQASVFLFYISIGKVDGGTAPIVDAASSVYSNPLPHVLILTAIVVGVATTALGLALIIRIYRSYGSVDETTIAAAESTDAAGDTAANTTTTTDATDTTTREPPA